MDPCLPVSLLQSRAFSCLSFRRFFLGIVKRCCMGRGFYIVCCPVETRRGCNVGGSHTNLFKFVVWLGPRLSFLTFPQAAKRALSASLCLWRSDLVV